MRSCVRRPGAEALGSTANGATRTAIFTAAALVAFAANSLLCRAALGARSIDAWSFTAVRLSSGALVLALLVRLTQREPPAERAGSFGSAFALFGYAAAFSLAYLRIPAGVGALVLFACVQATMIGWSALRGSRPSARETAGIAVALGGLALLTLPGALAPDLLGVGLMAVAGVAWGAYSLRGRGSRAPLRATAANFARSVPLAVCGLLAALAARSAWHASPRGVVLAAASGALASGLGYTVWYAALRDLAATKAAALQLLVPILTATAATLMLGERITLRLVVSGALILGGVGTATWRKK